MGMIVTPNRAEKKNYGTIMAAGLSCFVVIKEPPRPIKPSIFPSYTRGEVTLSF